MNLLVTIPSIEVGGAEIFLVRLLNLLADRGVRVFLLDFEQEKRDPGLIRLFSPKVTLLDNPLGSTLIRRILGKAEYTFKMEENSLSYTIYTRFLAWIIRKHKISLIHSHLYRSDRIIARCVSGTPAVTTLHGCYNAFGPDRSAELVRVLSTFKAIVYIAERNLIPLRQVEQSQALLNACVKIYNGIPLPKTLPQYSKPEGTLPRIVVVSRCIREKGWDLVIEAVKAINGSDLRLEAEFVGDGDYLETLKQRHQEHRFLIFSGKKMDVNPAIAAADICCFPSVYPNESFPNTILEYMMHGKAIISNTIGEVEHMLSSSDGTTCALLAPKTSDQAALIAFYHTAIQELLDHEAKRLELGRKAAEAVKKFDLNHCADAYMKLYDTFRM